METGYSIKNQIRSFPFFRGMPEGDLDVLLESAIVRDYPKRCFVFLQDDSADGFFVVLSGWVKLSNINPEGNEAAVLMRTQGDLFGITSVIRGGIRLASAEAVTACQLLEIPGNALRERAGTSPELMSRILGAMAGRIEALQISNACFSLKDASRRVACHLLRLSSSMIGKGGVFKFPYEKAIAAMALGMDQATFSRGMARLENFGVTSQNGEVDIADFSVLSEHCCAECPISGVQCAGRRLKPAASSLEVPVFDVKKRGDFAVSRRRYDGPNRRYLDDPSYRGPFRRISDAKRG